MKTFFEYNGKIKKLKNAVICANLTMNDENFLSDIRTIKYFDMSKDADNSLVSGEELVKILKTNKIKIIVLTYRSFWWFSRVYGYYKGGKNIYLNTRKFGRSVASIAGSLAHEAIHVYDNFVPHYLGHGDNSSVGKGKTAPYLFGKRVKEYVKNLNKSR